MVTALAAGNRILGTDYLFAACLSLPVGRFDVQAVRHVD